MAAGWSDASLAPCYTRTMITDAYRFGFARLLAGRSCASGPGSPPFVLVEKPS